MKILHFYMVFNPLFNEDTGYASQAHEFHQTFKTQHLKGATDHFHWGKMKISAGATPLNIENYKKVIADNKSEGFDTFLFISDFTNFWVGKVEDVSAQAPRMDETLSYYYDKTVEIWFKLSDFDLLCKGRETLERIGKLQVDNEYFEKKHESLNPYLSGLRYPMIVEDNRGEDYFRCLTNEETVTKRLVDHNPLLETQEKADGMRSTLTCYTIPQSNFEKIPDLLQKQILWTEHLFSQIHGHTPNDLKSMEEVAFSYARILEGLLNAVLMLGIKRELGNHIARRIKARVSKGDLNFDEHKQREYDRELQRLNKNQNIKEIHHVLVSGAWQELRLDAELKGELREMWQFLQSEITSELTDLIVKHEIIEFRNNQAHLYGNNVSKGFEQALAIRNRILGVGHKGLINIMMEKYKLQIVNLVAKEKKTA